VVVGYLNLSNQSLSITTKIVSLIIAHDQSIVCYKIILRPLLPELLLNGLGINFIHVIVKHFYMDYGRLMKFSTNISATD
jgi:ABC-type polysaccharide/polyol phosphate export permease